MGISLYVKDHEDILCVYMGYESFKRLREFCATSASPEFGEHYGSMMYAFIYHDTSAYDRKTEALIKKYNLKERYLDFLYQSDCDGKLSPAKCKALYDVIKDSQTDELFGYSARPNDCMSLDDFKTALKFCFENKVYLQWD